MWVLECFNVVSVTDKATHQKRLKRNKESEVLDDVQLEFLMNEHLDLLDDFMASDDASGGGDGSD